jgi:hypothetical protein
VSSNSVSAPHSGAGKPQLEPISSDSWRAGVGYLFAVTMATIAFVLKSAWSVDAGASNWFGLFVEVEVIIAFWIHAFFMAAWPYAATLAVARRYRIGNILYYLACGAVTGTLLTLVVLIPAWKHPSEHDGGFIDDWLRLVPSFAAYGCCGALAFWYKAGRHLGAKPP